MKRTWKQIVVGVGMVVGTTGACLAAGGHHGGGNGNGHSKPNFGGNQTAQPRVQTVMNQGIKTKLPVNVVGTVPTKPVFPVHPIGPKKPPLGPIGPIGPIGPVGPVKPPVKPPIGPIHPGKHVGPRFPASSTQRGLSEASAPTGMAGSKLDRHLAGDSSNQFVIDQQPSSRGERDFTGIP